MQTRVVGDPVPKPLPSDPLEGEFAPSQFFELTLEQKLSAPSFERRKSGIQARGAALVSFGKPVPRLFTYEDKLKDPDAAVSQLIFATRVFSGLDAVVAIGVLEGSALGRSGILSERTNAKVAADGIEISRSEFRIVDASTMQAVAGIEAATTRTDADRMLDQTVALQPGLAGQLVVISALEVG